MHTIAITAAGSEWVSPRSSMRESSKATRGSRATHRDVARLAHRIACRHDRRAVTDGFALADESGYRQARLDVGMELRP